MELSTLEQKQLKIFALVAFGMPLLMGIVMYVGYRQHLDLTTLVNTQMYYPAAGGILALWLTKKGDTQMPKIFYGYFLALTFLFVCMSVASVLISNVNWIIISSLLIVVSSLIGWIIYFVTKKDKRRAYGLLGQNYKQTVLMILLFLALYMLRTAIAYFIEGGMSAVLTVFSNGYLWLNTLIIMINFPFAFTAFFGEEYGWRYFLQPLLQKRFGKLNGVIVLGIVWGLWHLPINLFYYSPQTALQSIVGQLITCISYSIFFGYVYMKTNNIWSAVWIHFFNNNLIPVITLSFSADVIANQIVTWPDIVVSLILNGVLFASFALSKQYKQNVNGG
ncbi:MAG: CPBP family intramembrane metalloprotease [Erysipelotrichaceae bacterium]|nr:CPBP family intramembrane metalloprotease [Erysipelotrichaceae bacterium]MDY5251239.1 type II CAAX endopeptidase family protein [Erysipelotrichaceae bacterium]